MTEQNTTYQEANDLPPVESKKVRSRYPVTIDEEAIRLARKGRADACPNTVAVIRDVLKKYKLPWRGKPRTDDSGLSFIDKSTNEKVTVILPKRVRAFLRMYDDGQVVDSQGDIKVREFGYTLDLSQAIRIPINQRKVTKAIKQTLEKTSESESPLPPPSDQAKPTKQRKQPKAKSLDMSAKASASRRKGITGFEEEKAFLLSKPIDEPQLVTT